MRLTLAAARPKGTRVVRSSKPHLVHCSPEALKLDWLKFEQLPGVTSANARSRLRTDVSRVPIRGFPDSHVRPPSSISVTLPPVTADVFAGEHPKVVDWLSDLSWVPNGAVVLISCAGATGSKAKASPPRSAAASEVAAASADGRGSGGKHGGSVAPVAAPEAADVGEGSQAEQHAEEDEEEALALAALGRIRESYRTRAKERQSGATGRARGYASDPEAGKRMQDKRREVESTAQSRQASCRTACP